MKKEIIGFTYEEVKEIRKALNLAITQMRENDEIEENENKFQMLSELYDTFSDKEDELEENDFWETCKDNEIE
jgi:hypothetical protein